MSATNRNIEGHERIAHDYYATPKWTIHRLLEAVDLPGGRWLEPGVGDGAIVRAVNEKRPTNLPSSVHWTTIDIRFDTPSDFNEDFLAWKYDGPKFAVSCTNPPYSLALPFVEKMLQVSEIVVLLTRLNWLAGPRADFLRRNPCDVFVLPNRPSFVHGGTDATEYQWAVWGPGRGGRWELLADTPLSERRSLAPDHLAPPKYATP